MARIGSQPNNIAGGDGGGGGGGVYCGGVGHPSGYSGGSYAAGYSGGSYAAGAHDENAAFEPPDVFCALGSLIVEGRLPVKEVVGAGKVTVKGGQAGGAAGQQRHEGRGFSEGPHVELPGRISRHKCSSEEYLCAKNENFRRHMLLLWQNNVSMSIEVLLCSDCRDGRAKAGSLEVTTVPEPGSILLEQWTISVLTGPREVGMDSFSLLQAVRSYLHFSQLSAWYNKTGGTSPKNILIRVTVPGEEFSSKFSRAPEKHYFPIASVGYNSGIAVNVRSLPRTDDIPLVVCSHSQQIDGEEEEEGKLALAGSLSWRDPNDIKRSRDPTDLRRTLVKAKFAGVAEGSSAGGVGGGGPNWSPGQDCPGRLIKSDSMDSMLGDSLLDPPQSLSKMAPKRYQSPSRCGSPSLEAPDHLLGGRREHKPTVSSWIPPPTYEQTMAQRHVDEPLDYRLNRHDLIRRRDMNHYLGLHPRLLHGHPRLSIGHGPRLSLPPKPNQPVKPTSTSIPCRAMTCQKPVLSDQLPTHCTRSGKHICEFDELEDGVKPLDTGIDISGSPTGDNYKQTELGAKQKGWSARMGRSCTPYSGGRSTTPYSRDSSSDSSNTEQRLKSKVVGGHQHDLEADLTSTEIEDVLSVLRSRASPTCSKDQRRQLEGNDELAYPPAKCRKEDGIDDLLCQSALSRRSSIDDIFSPQKLLIPPQVTQVWRAEVSKNSTDKSVSGESPSQNKQKHPPGLEPDPQQQQIFDSSPSDDEPVNNSQQDHGNILLGAILKHSKRTVPAIHSARDISQCSSPSTPTAGSPETPDTPHTVPHTHGDLVDLCQELEAKCLISHVKTNGINSSNKENVENGADKPFPHSSSPVKPFNSPSSPMRIRSFSEASSLFKINFGTGIPTIEPLDMSFDDDDQVSFDSSCDVTEPKSKSEKRRSSIDDDSVPSANKKAAFRKSFDSATSMVFHSRNGLPLTSSPAPMRRGGIKFDFDSGITTPKDIKRALFESQSPEDCSSVGSPKKKKRDPRRLLSTSAPASVNGNNLLGNFEESVLNGRLEPASTVEGFTAEIGASGTFHPKHMTLPVTVFFYTLCENSNVASPYLGHINLGKKGYRVPEKGTIQLTLFNPLGTVVKMFVVMYDLTDMPPNSQTFLRQRTLYMPADQCDTHKDSRKWLRYLIHLRLMSSRSGKIYLHTDVRMIIFRKSDLDTASDHEQGKGFELRSFTRGPSNPKFSPRK